MTFLDEGRTGPRELPPDWEKRPEKLVFTVKIIQVDEVYKYEWTLMLNGEPATKRTRGYFGARYSTTTITGKTDTIMGARVQSWLAKRRYMKLLKHGVKQKNVEIHLGTHGRKRRSNRLFR